MEEQVESSLDSLTAISIEIEQWALLLHRLQSVGPLDPRSSSSIFSLCDKLLRLRQRLSRLLDQEEN